MADDGNMGVIERMMNSDDELLDTVAELWLMVQHHHRKIESLEAQLGIQCEVAGEIDIPQE